jgi:tRNA (cytidine/uridine-2'-O-)-methyltransferase
MPAIGGTIADPRRAGPGIRLLLWGVQSPINLGMILRVAETYRVPIAAIGAERAVTSTTSDFACGALERAGFEHLADTAAARAWQGNARMIATSIDRDAVALPDFRFEPGDVVLLGNEYDGLPADVASNADARIVIPMADVWTPKPRSKSPIDPARSAPVSRDGQPNLNVAVAGGIVCYAAYVQAMATWSARGRAFV